MAGCRLDLTSACLLRPGGLAVPDLVLSLFLAPCPIWNNTPWQWEQGFVLSPCTAVSSVSRLSALAHSRHWIGFTSFPRTAGALMKCSAGSGAVCSFRVETPEQVSCFLAWGGSGER